MQHLGKFFSTSIKTQCCRQPNNPALPFASHCTYWLHVRMSGQGVMSGVMSGCHVRVSCQDVMSGCHVRMSCQVSCQGVMSGCHVRVSCQGDSAEVPTLVDCKILILCTYYEEIIQNKIIFLTLALNPALAKYFQP